LATALLPIIRTRDLGDCSRVSTRPDLFYTASRELYDFMYLCPAVDIREYLALNRPINAPAEGAGVRAGGFRGVGYICLAEITFAIATR